MNVFFIAGYGLKFFTMYTVNSYMDIISKNSSYSNLNAPFWSVVSDVTENENLSSAIYNKTAGDVYEAFYWLNSGMLKKNYL
jgi:hypothetical protein